MAKLTHVDISGNALMVDVSSKDITSRTASAEGKIYMSKECFDLVLSHSHKKGDVLTISQVAGIMASKRTSSLIPLTHNINLTNSEVTFTEISENDKYGFICHSLMKCNDVTGVEMEALTAVSVALLTIYDMCKAVDKRMLITDIYLVKKTGGKSGEFNY